MRVRKHPSLVFLRNIPDSKFLREIVQLRGVLVHHHIIFDDDGAHLIDGGFLGGIRRIHKTLGARGMDFSNVRSLVLTHGHLDHTLNAARLKKLSNCRIYAPKLDRLHIEGRHRYRGWSKICGWLEFWGRLLFCYSVPAVDEWFEEDDTLCAGLRVISLPGHTGGHCGYVWEDEKLLIAADLFTQYTGSPQPPPRIFNDDHAEALRSICKAAAMNFEKVYLNHAHQLTPRQAARSLQEVANSFATLDESINVTPEKR